MSDSKQVLFAGDIGARVGLGALTVARHSRGERFSPTLGKGFPAPFTSGHGTRLRWLAAEIDAWLARRAAPATPPATPAPTTPPAKRGRGRPPKRLQQEGGAL